MPIEASNPVEAWMFILNPADTASGELGFLETAEYLAIKQQALRLLDLLANPPVESTHTGVQSKILAVMKATPQTSKQISPQIGCEEQTVRKYLPRLAEEGLIFRAPRGGYYRMT
jgi:hypothetical protein